MPREQVPADDDPATISVDKALLAVEITSRSNAETDRTTKLDGYARAGMPLYLLIDRFAKQGQAVKLYSFPLEGSYQESHRVPFGKPVTLPAPFDLTLDTTRF